LKLYDLADRKGYDVTQSTMRDHVRLIDGEGNLVKNKNGGAAFTYAEARRFLETLPDRKR
jgi:repressor of nif and glnA expression